MKVGDRVQIQYYHETVNGRTGTIEEIGTGDEENEFWVKMDDTQEGEWWEDTYLTVI